MIRIGRLPENDAANGWSNILAPRAPNAPLKGNVTADWLVIGAGYAGLAAARRLAENRPNESVVIVDACAVGDGASARNSGFVIDLPHNVGGDGDDHEGPFRALRLARAASRWLGEIVETHRIDCQWSPVGQYMAAASDAGMAALDGFRAELEAVNEPYETITDPRPRIGTDRYRELVHAPTVVLMQPASLVRGLAATLPENVTLYENAPVIGIDFADPVRAETPGGTIAAGGCILAVNGFAPDFGVLKNRIFPVMLFCSITRPLTDAEHDAMGCPADWGVVPSLPFGGPTIRYTQDRRLTMRSRFAYRPGMKATAGDYRKARALQERQLKDRYPHLPDDIIEHTWSGCIALAQNFAPGFGRHAENVWTAVCQNGVGVTKGTIAGQLAADMATGRDNPLMADMEALGTPSKLPPRPFRDIGIMASFRKFAWDARAEV